MKEYLAQPDVKERIKIKKLNEKMTKVFKNLGMYLGIPAVVIVGIKRKY